MGETEYIRSYQTYIDVIEDINETPLNESEKRLETYKVTNARKETFGESYSALPPWNCNCFNEICIDIVYTMPNKEWNNMLNCPTMPNMNGTSLNES